jgi:hypothetical protein
MILLQAVTACQSDGLSLCTQLVQSQLFDSDKCNHCASSILAQNSFIRQVLRRLKPNLSDNNMSASVQSVSSSSSDLSSSEGEGYSRTHTLMLFMDVSLHPPPFFFPQAMMK